jgi:hypothetical protein
MMWTKGGIYPEMTMAVERSKNSRLVHLCFKPIAEIEKGQGDIDACRSWLPSRKIVIGSCITIKVSKIHNIDHTIDGTEKRCTHLRLSL